MKIIDFHTHYYPDKIVEKALSKAIEFITPHTDGTRSGLLKSMTKAQIACSVTLPLVNTPENARGLNHWAMRENHDEIIMLGSVHPRQTDLAETLQFIAENHLRGIKLHPEYQQFDFADELCNPIWEGCIRHDLFVITHSGFDVMFPPPYHCDPSKLLAVHRRYPQLKLIGAHLGGMNMWGDEIEVLLGEDIYLDLAFVTESMISRDRLTDLIRRHKAERILFASDSPWCDQAAHAAFIASLPLTESEKSAIFHGNAEKLLKIAKNPTF